MLLVEATCDLEHHVWIVLHLSWYSAPLLEFTPQIGLKVNRKIKPVVILKVWCSSVILFIFIFLFIYLFFLLHRNSVKLAM